MHTKQTICLLNDSFPPQVDGVANAVVSYAKHIKADGDNPMVVTPAYPQADDSQYPYPVIRYPSISFRKMDGYMAGVPFSPEVARRIAHENVRLLHSHCPIMSTFMARELRQIVDAPIVLTYHTKYDIDIANLVKSKQLQNSCKKVLVENINACDEVWVVSEGAGENLRSLGYEGDYIVMPNGVDFPVGRVSDEQIADATNGYDLPDHIPIYLYVGRMMWYKGIKITLDALAQLKKHQKDFRMVFIGNGDDLDEIKEYAVAAGLKDECIFTGTIHHRNVLRAWYCKANLFLFPSTFDTNGLVVREAAACELASVLINNSCAAEGVTDGRNGFLVEEDAESLCACLLSLYDQMQKARTVGQTASNELYISWETSVKAAMERYQVVIDRYKSNQHRRHRTPVEGFMKVNGEIMESLAGLSINRKTKDSLWKNTESAVKR